MKLKHMIVAACLSTAIAAGSAFAFSGNDRDADPVKRAEYLQKSLQLSADQQKKAQQLFEKGTQQRSALEKKYTIAERDKFRDEMRTLRGTQQKEFDALLTPAQREAMAAQKQRHGMHGKHGKHGEHGRDGHGDWDRGDRGPRGEPMPKADKPTT